MTDGLIRRIISARRRVAQERRGAARRVPLAIPCAMLRHAFESPTRGRFLKSSARLGWAGLGWARAAAHQFRQSVRPSVRQSARRMRATCDEGVCSSAAACLIIAAYMSAMHGELCEMSPAHAERISAQDTQKPRVGPVHEAGSEANRFVGMGCSGARHTPESGGAAAASCPEGFSGVCSAETDCKKRAASTAHSAVRRRRATVWRAMPCHAMPCHAMPCENLLAPATTRDGSAHFWLPQRVQRGRECRTRDESVCESSDAELARRSMVCAPLSTCNCTNETESGQAF